MPRAIDTLHLGVDRVICAWERDGLIVDPGPASTLPTLLEALGDDYELRAVLLTHIHLDHAAAAGALLERFPSARVYVHEVGAAHVIDPSRLWASAGRLYGAENMLSTWGEMLPVPAERVTALRGGETVEGMEVLHTPGHAAHHITYLDQNDGGAYVGDVAGVRIPPAELTVMPTPPPEIDVDAWQRSLALLAERNPASLRLTHWGEVGDAATQLDAAGTVLARMAELAEADDREMFLAELEGDIDAQPEDCAERMRNAMPPEQVWLGLERWARKRREAAASS